jgi:hypothetical protein
MRPIRITLAWALLAGSAILPPLLSGCAAPTSGSVETRPAEGPRVRCLGDPSRDTSAGTRPLFFFFCMESP